jgi:hypothetical protein
VLKTDAACVTGGNTKPDRMKTIAGMPKKGLRAANREHRNQAVLTHVLHVP